ncbi:sigma factor G inhibitor Gin [Dethiothermospora halolimnae]|uniref:sigma factor G inhibitor Gin n=1 Tax=Dethiothermospora halolimnae TaxID=3114390 RepID=UPI003CCC171F
MANNRCKVCGENKKSMGIFGIHICLDCLEEIGKTDMDDIKYEYYKSIITNAWIDYIMVKGEKV